MTARFRELQEKYKGDPPKLQPEMQAFAKEMRSLIPPASIDDVVAYIDHVVKLGGIGAVGIGSDYDGVGCVPAGLDDVSKFQNLTRALLEHGYSAEEIRKIYRGNTLRLMRSVEQAAHNF